MGMGMQFMAIVTRRAEFSPEEFGALADIEARRGVELYAEGVFRQLWAREDGRGAIIAIEAADRDAAEAAIASLPMVQRGMLSVELHGLKAYRGFTAMLNKV